MNYNKSISEGLLMGDKKKNYKSVVHLDFSLAPYS